RNGNPRGVSRASGRGVFDVKLHAPLSVPLLGAKAARRVDLPASRCKERFAQRLIRLAERHRVKPRAIAAAQPRANVILTHDLCMYELDIGNDQVGLGIAGPERSRLREFIDNRRSCCSRRDRSFDLERKGSSDMPRYFSELICEERMEA